MNEKKICAKCGKLIKTGSCCAYTQGTSVYLACYNCVEKLGWFKDRQNPYKGEKT